MVDFTLELISIVKASKDLYLQKSSTVVRSDVLKFSLKRYNKWTQIHTVSLINTVNNSIVLLCMF